MTNVKAVVRGRSVLVLLAVGLLLVIGGDRGGAQSAIPRGMDPLEVLDLQVKPNVIIVLDSSGSMSQTVGGTETTSGDHPRSKLAQAKAVLEAVIDQNKNTVTFLFGQYTQANSTLQNTGAGNDRFRYTTNSIASPSMLTTELTMNSQPAPMLNITASNNKIWFLERTDTTSTKLTYETCSVTVPSGTYSVDTTTMTNLATTLTNLLKLATYSPSCVKTGSSTNTKANSYTVTWSSAAMAFTIARTTGANYFQFRMASGASTAGGALGFMLDVPDTAQQPPPSTTVTFGNTYWSNASFTSTTLGGGGSSSGFQAFQYIAPQWNQLYYQEAGLNCVVSITTGFYQTGEALASEIENEMNACTGRGATPNVYSVTFNDSNGQFTFSAVRSANAVTLQWGTATNSIRDVLQMGTNNQSLPDTSNNNSIGLLRRSTSDGFTEVNAYDSNGDGVGDTNIVSYDLIAGRLWNGQTFNVTAAGQLCGVSFGTGTYLAAQAATNPPAVYLQQVTSCSNQTSVGAPVTFTFAGGQFGGNNISCNGFAAKVPLQTCDSTTPQDTSILTFLAPELGQDSKTPYGMLDYLETTSNGTFAVDTGHSTPGLMGGIKDDGNTPIAKSLYDIRNGNTTFTGFGNTATNGLWGAGQAAAAGPPATLAVPAISSQGDPKARTIIIFVTDGDDTCASASDDDGKAKQAAFEAQRLYTQITAGQPASSVSTYVVGFGSGGDVTRLNFIAWGGSGLGQGPTTSGPTPSVTTTGTSCTATVPNINCGWSETNAQIIAKRALCPSCIDAYVAPDAKTLSTVIESIIEQGASLGEFTAQQSIVGYPVEYVGEVVGPVSKIIYSPDNPGHRYDAIVPTAYSSRFTLPGYKGEFKAVTAGEVVRWTAGQALFDLVHSGPAKDNTGIDTCAEDKTPSPTPGLCTFASLVGTNVATPNGRIKRHIYTTSNNGVFPVSITNYFDISWLRAPTSRASLWPPDVVVDPADGVVGALDGALGISSLTFTQLQTLTLACTGTGAPSPCALNEARKEAREIILAYMAGAQLSTTGPALANRSTIPAKAGQLLFTGKSWIMAEGTMGDPALITQPIDSAPTNSPWGNEYIVMRDGPRTTTGSDGQATNGIDFGLGLRSPDKDALAPAPSSTSSANPDTRTTLKPVMTVAYMPANDMLHAFRAGPNTALTSPACTPNSTTRDCGGEELWGFIPFDQLGKLMGRLQPQTRNNHTFMLSASVRFADVFVPNAGTTGNYNGSLMNHDVNGTTPNAHGMKGVWRRVLYFGRGIGGKYLTALDVTAPGPYTRSTKDPSNLIIGPIPLWSRGNPDTVNGLAGGTKSNTTDSNRDFNAYAQMGETWSTPAIARVDKLDSVRKPCPGGGVLGQVCSDQTGGGVAFVAFVGSGYSGNPTSEGHTFYTLDALTGDVVASVDVGSRSPKPKGDYDNALVASPALYAAEEFGDQTQKNVAAHPADSVPSRIYLGDLHGRLWKFLTTNPGSSILFADLGSGQPVGVGASLIKDPRDTTGKPDIFVIAGDDSRAAWDDANPFKLFGFRDERTDDDTTADAATCGPAPVLPCLFSQALQNLFRGTMQPATVYTAGATGDVGITLFGGTRFISPPPLGGTLATPSDNGACRSRFDSIVYVLKSSSGAAAVDLNATGDDSYVIFANSRKAAITIVQDPTGTGGSAVSLDEGLASTCAGGSNSGGTTTISAGLGVGGERPRPGGVSGNEVLTQRWLPSSMVCQEGN